MYMHASLKHLLRGSPFALLPMHFMHSYICRGRLSLHHTLLTHTHAFLTLCCPPPLPPPAPFPAVQVMGLLQGKVQNDTFVVIDSFALPVEGTETRVNAQAEAYEYMVDFQGTSKVKGRGWTAHGGPGQAWYWFTIAGRSCTFSRRPDSNAAISC